MEIAMTAVNMKTLSWGERFALMNHFKASDAAVCQLFDVTPDELATARDLLAAGTFIPSTSIDVTLFAEQFSGVNIQIPAPVQPTTMQTTATPTSNTFAKPESAGRKPVVPKKRGRKGDKIQTALMSVPTTPVPVDKFMEQYGVSLAVLRQAKRFAAAHGEEFAANVGNINVRQDKETKVLMIWKG